MWHQTLYELPPEGVTVCTKIDDERGCRNEGKLYRRGNLWFLSDGSMYVYYTPTHWRYQLLDETKILMAKWRI